MAMTERYDEGPVADPATEANEADLAEQQAPVTEEATAPISTDPEADPADAAEQAAVVGGDDDYPHDGEIG